jgi:xanthine dehydrogenase accessory factor
MEEPVVCDRDSVRVDMSKCKGKSLGVATHVAHFAKDLGFKVTVVDPFYEEGAYEADEVIAGSAFTVPDDVVKDSYSVVATRHVYDTWAIMKSLTGGAKHTWVVMSLRRAKVIMGRLLQAGITKDQLRELRIPAGLDLGASTEREIAFSIIAEVLMVDRSATGLPLSQTKSFAEMVDKL